MSFFEPNYTVLAFLFIKKFLFLEVIAVLALLRLALGPGVARVSGGVALVLALAGIATIFAPAVGLNSGAVYAAAAQSMNHGAGMTALLVPAGVLIVGAITRNRRGGWVEVLAALSTVGLIGLWIATWF